METICAWCKGPLEPAKWGWRHTGPNAPTWGYCHKYHPPQPLTIERAEIE